MGKMNSEHYIFTTGKKKCWMVREGKVKKTEEGNIPDALCTLNVKL